MWIEYTDLSAAGSGSTLPEKIYCAGDRRFRRQSGPSGLETNASSNFI